MRGGSWIPDAYKSLNLSDLQELKAKVVDELKRVRASNTSRRPKTHLFWRAKEAEARARQPAREKHHLFCSIEQLNSLIVNVNQERDNQAKVKGESKVAMDPNLRPWYRQLLRPFVNDQQSTPPKSKDLTAQHHNSNDEQSE